MPTEFFTKWVTALETGVLPTGEQLVQGHERLTTNYGGVSKDCCLGVACKLAVAEGIIQVEDPTAYEVTYGEDFDGPELDEHGRYNHSATVLPRKVVDALGFTSADPDYIMAITDENDMRFKDGPEPYQFTTTLSGLNDDEDWSFPQIAEAVKTIAPE